VNKDTKKPDLSKVNAISKNLTESLEKNWGKRYIKAKIERFDSGTTNLSNETNFSFFEIKKSISPIYTLVNSSSDLTKQKNKILEKYSKMIDNYYNLMDMVDDQVDENTINSLEIIGKVLTNRKKKIESAFNRLVVDDSWNAIKIQEEFSYVLVRLLKDILESTSISISNGLKQNTVYEDIVKILNSFYGCLGIYTKEYKANDEYSDNDMDNLHLIPSQDDEIKDKSYQNKIKSVDSLAYLFDDSIVILEANIVVWRVS